MEPCLAQESNCAPRSRKAHGDPHEASRARPAAQAALAGAHITVNKNAIPNDPEKPFVTSGIRIGSPAITTRGFSEIETERLAHLIADVLDAPLDDTVIATVKLEAHRQYHPFGISNRSVFPSPEKVLYLLVHPWTG